MTASNFELTVAEIMREPMVRALMKADRVDPREFEARLRLVASNARQVVDEADASDEENAVSGGHFPAPLRRTAAELRCGC